MNSNQDLVNYLLDSGVLKTPNLVAAFTSVDRRDFVLPRDQDSPYDDSPLFIGAGQTISQPSTVAFMLELSQPMIGEKILDVGSGSGWTTALLAYIVGKKGAVYGVERVQELIIFGQNNLKKYKFSQAKIVPAERKLGLVSQAFFDKILVSAASNDVPDELIAQLKIGGIMVIPVNNSIWKIVKLSATEIKTTKFPGFVFVPLIKN